MRPTKRHILCLIYLATLFRVLGVTSPARAELISPADAQGIRRLPGFDPILLNFLAVSRLPEDRTVLAFDVSRFSGVVPPVLLNLDLQAIDAGGPAGVIDVFAFPSAGAVTPDLFDAPASLVTSFSANQSGLYQVDVTGAVQSAVDSGERFLAFRLSTTTDDRYFLGAIAGRPLPTLSAVPEPSSLALVSTGLLALLGTCWKRRRRRMGVRARLLLERGAP